MNVTIESSGTVVIAYLIGEIDHHTAGNVREKIDNTLMFKKPNTLILDFKNVTLQTKKIMELAGLSSIAKIKETENEYKKAN